jgi:hypothetical protein
MAGAQITLDGVGFPTWELYNNSTGAQVLAVLDIQIFGESDNRVIQQRGHLGSTAATTQPIVSSQAVGPGIVYSSLQGSQVNGLWFPSTPEFGTPAWNHDFPFNVILPGWALVFSCDAGTTGVDSVSLLWQVCSADEIDDMDFYG